MVKKEWGRSCFPPMAPCLPQALPLLLASLPGCSPAPLSLLKARTLFWKVLKGTEMRCTPFGREAEDLQRLLSHFEEKKHENEKR